MNMYGTNPRRPVGPRLRVLAWVMFALAVVGLILALAACKPIGPAPYVNASATPPADPCLAAPSEQTCDAPAAAAGAHKGSAYQPAPPGFRRVVLQVTMKSASGALISRPVHLLAMGRTASGVLAVDARTGSPWSVMEDITTPDDPYFDLGPGVVNLNVALITMGRAGESLWVVALVDGKTYSSAMAPSGRWVVNNPNRMGGTTRPLQATVDVNVPPL